MSICMVPRQMEVERGIYRNAISTLKGRHGLEDLAYVCSRVVSLQNRPCAGCKPATPPKGRLPTVPLATVLLVRERFGAVGLGVCVDVALRETVRGSAIICHQRAEYDVLLILALWNYGWRTQGGRRGRRSPPSKALLDFPLLFNTRLSIPISRIIPFIEAPHRRPTSADPCGIADRRRVCPAAVELRWSNRRRRSSTSSLSESCIFADAAKFDLDQPVDGRSHPSRL
jgi:hypothetical protein